MKRWTPIDQLIPFLAGAVFTVFLEMLSNELIGSTPWVKRLFVIVGLFLLGGAFLYRLRPRRVRVNMGVPHILRRPEDAPSFARRGLVAFVSLYNPFKSPIAKNLSDRERQEAAANLDYQTLDFENSNLEPLIKGVVAHASRLEHCWLISTSSLASDQAGSALFVPALVRYLENLKGLRCRFHYTSEYTVSLEDDALLARNTRDKVVEIFDEAQRIGIPPSEIVADITSGYRAMPLGMILACLDVDYDIQFMGTHYDRQGKPEGELFPICFPFDVQLADMD